MLAVGAITVRAVPVAVRAVRVVAGLGCCDLRPSCVWPVEAEGEAAEVVLLLGLVVVLVVRPQVRRVLMLAVRVTVLAAAEVRLLLVALPGRTALAVLRVRLLRVTR